MSDEEEEQNITRSHTHMVIKPVQARVQQINYASQPVFMNNGYNRSTTIGNNKQSHIMMGID